MIRILSLDVVLGACVSAWFIAQLCGVEVRLVTIVALGMAVWLIYTADHLWDAYRLQHPAHTVRHGFHQRYFRSLIVTWLIVASLGIVLLFRIPPSVFRGGLLLSAGVIGYFVINQLFNLSRTVPKELLAALLYTLGIFLPVIVQADGMNLVGYLLFGQFFLLALANLTLISWYELESDQLDGASSLATQYGTASVQLISRACIFLSVALAVWAMFSISFAGYLVLLVMSVVLGSIWVFPVWYAKNERYRWVADGIFLLPAFYPLVV
ncbi:hypothetical protein [Tunicatimonas pelagia]|uniref:hypothetical protein n=1 Tax=Tunicatimonas pelagia TaxID=931531 RepID=UPI0026667B4B|nr:hypothetical protein [Tunicatimonas pelagia]WKN40554.1 hypothetical protein P0M28_16060 [Tunicatimonas pelagia]